MVRVVSAAIPVVALLTLGDVEPGVAASAAADRVVAKVGDSVITAEDLKRRLAAVPGFQLRAYGATPEEIKRNYLEQVLVPELLFAQGARARGKQDDFDVRARQRDLLRTAMLLQVREEVVERSDVKPEQVAEFYKANLKRYQTPARVSVWRILVADRAKAEEIIQAAKASPTPKTWSELAQKHSLDKSTSLRGGNLGFLTADGLSADGKTQIPEALAKAAFAVKDGEIVGEPVPEGSAFAVVWRRGSMPAINRTLEEEAKAIQKILLRDRTRSAQEELLETLRKRHVTDVDADGAELVGISGGGRVEMQNKPGRIVRRAGRTAPENTPRGLR